MIQGARECVGKYVFETAARAKKIARLRRRDSDELARQVAYKCRACGFWHIGEISESARRVDDDRAERRYGLKRIMEENNA